MRDFPFHNREQTKFIATLPANSNHRYYAV